MTNSTSPDLRYFEDLAEGEVIDLGRTKVTRQMILDFAHEFDPLPFHLDEKAAKASLLGGLAASGWQTGALTLRMLVNAFFFQIAAAGGLGFSNLKWKKPVMVDDTIWGTATIVGLRRSRSHPDRGVLTMDLDIRNQRGQQVMTMTLANMVLARDSGIIPDPVQPYDVSHGGGHAP